MRARLFLLAAALVAFGASLGSGFHFDDYAIFSDPALQSARGWMEVWAPRQTRPLTYFTFWLNRQIGAGDPLGYHLFNLLLHLAAVLLAWECLRRLLPERAALIAGLIFAMHPIQSEAVNYVWARSIVLATLFLPWRAVAVARGPSVGRARVVRAPALLAKEECAAFPLVLAWLVWRGDCRPRGSRGALAAMLALSVAAGARVIWATASRPARRRRASRHLAVALFAGAGRGDLAIPPADGRALWVHGRSRYPRGTVDRDRRMGAAGGRDVMLCGAGSCRHVVYRGTDSAASELFLLPGRRSLGRPPHVSSDVRLRRCRRHSAGAHARLPCSAAIAVVLVALSVQRTMVWMTEASLWQEAVDRAPNKLRPKLQLARALPAAKALDLLAKARLDAPYNPDIATETGKILLTEGQPDGALEEFGRALALSPMDARNMNNRGVALQALGQTEAARADFERALRTDPSLDEAKENLGETAPQAAVRPQDTVKTPPIEPRSSEAVLRAL